MLQALTRQLNERTTDAARLLLEPLIDQLAARGELVESPAHEVERDPELLASMLPYFRLAQVYFGSEVRGFDQVPDDEPVLFVGNHSGGAMTLDPLPLILHWLETRGCEAPLYGLAYDLFFSVPRVGDFMRRLGCLPASPENAHRVIDRGASVIVFPGGDYEVFRPWHQRNRIEFGGRTGFIELALRKKIKVVPMTIHGAHETTITLTRGHHLAGSLGLDRLRVKVFPIVWNLPLGPVPAFVPQLPIPSKMTVELGAPIDWGHLGADAAEDPEVVEACYAEITGRMQRTLSALAAETPNPILTQLNELRPSRLVPRMWQLFGPPARLR